MPRRIHHPEGPALMTTAAVNSAMQQKLLKQRNEIARLTKLVEQLNSDKANLRFDLHKANAHIKQLQDRDT